MNQISNSVVAITGASSGIGESLARLLLAQGAKVALGARRLDRLQSIVKDNDDNSIIVEMDVKNAADSHRLINAAIEKFGRLDSLVANAGMGMYGGILDHSDEDLQNMLDTNISGTIWPVRAAVPQFMQQGQGNIVIVSSVAGLSARANEAVYAASKHAQKGLAEGLDRELHKHNIKVSTFCPGGVRTEFAMQEGQGRTENSPELAEMLDSDDVAKAIISVLAQPINVRTLVYSMRGIYEEN